MEEEGEEMNSIFKGTGLFNPNFIEINTSHHDDDDHPNSFESDDHQNELLNESLFSGPTHSSQN